MTAWLVEWAAKSGVLLAVALAIAALLRRRSAAARHQVLAAGVLAVLALPLPMMLMPAWTPPVLLARPAALAVPAGAADVDVETTLRVPDAARGPQQTPVSASQPITVSGVVFVVWVVVATVLLLRLGSACLGLRRLASAARELRAGPWRDAARAIASELGLARTPTILRGDRHVLAVWGWRKPVVLLPEAAETWDAQRIAVVLSHELAHVARRDWPVQLAASALCAVCWFNPLAWLASRRLRRESELACDDRVLSRGIPAADYAAHLVDTARTLIMHREPWLPAPAMARPDSLEGRVEAMLNPQQDRTPVSVRRGLVTAAALLGVTLALAGVRAQAAFHSVTGSVADPTNGQVAGVSLTLTNAADESKYEVKSDATGRFVFTGVKPGTYAFESRTPGFATVRETLQVNGDLTRRVELRVGLLQETVTVSDQVTPAAAPVDPAVARQRAEAMQQRWAEKVSREEALCAPTAAPVKPGTIFPPVKIADVRPEYPEHLKAARTGGAVTMDASIGLDGTVREVTNVKGAHPDLEQAAARAVSQWRFTPTRLNCRPVEVQMHVTTHFTPRS